MAEENEIKKKRFVAFIDILGFKNKVDSETHEKVYMDLKFIKDTVRTINSDDVLEFYKKSLKLTDPPDRTKSFMFSDSLFIYSKSDTKEDLFKITLDLLLIIDTLTEKGIPIKGAISFGEVSVSSEENIFFGKPIIEASLLHDQLYQIGIVCDHNFEIKLEEILKEDNHAKIIDRFYENEKLFFKTGKITHLHLTVNRDKLKSNFVNALKKMYKKVSGHHRIYIDNSVTFYENWQKNLKRNNPQN